MLARGLGLNLDDWSSNEGFTGELGMDAKPGQQSHIFWGLVMILSACVASYHGFSWHDLTLGND